MTRNIFQALHDDHRAVSSRFEELAGTGASEVERRRVLVSSIREQILAHDEAEERVVYRALLDGEGLAALDPLYAHEHERAHSMLEELLALDPAGQDWLERTRELRALVTRHALAEECSLFERVRRRLDEPACQRLAERFDQAKEDVLARLRERGLLRTA